MSTDYRTGLVVGMILAGVAVIWVATRPSLSPEARMRWSSTTGPGDSAVGPADRQSGQAGHGEAPTPAHVPLTSIIESQPKSGGSVGPDTQAPARSPQAAAPPPTSDGGPDLTIYEKAEKIKTTRFHIVRKTETLSVIAQQYYGTPAKWQKLLEANKKVIKDPNKLQPGTKLIIPE